MNQVDFLPPSYHRAQQRRGRLVRQVVLIALVTCTLMAATVALKAHRHAQMRTAERLEETVKAERTALGVLTGLNHERQELLESFDLQRELEPAVTYALAVSSLGELLPEGVAIRELVMRSVRPTPEPLEEKADKRGRRNQAEESEEDVEPNLIGIELTGLAPDDLSVATFVSALDENPLFTRVTMRSSEGVNRNGLLAREFSLTTTIDLDREFRWVETAGEEVAHAE
ncbi:MAG: PilN domain-containing protein [Planctomycetota bacterium]